MYQKNLCNVDFTYEFSSIYIVKLGLFIMK